MEAPPPNAEAEPEVEPQAEPEEEPQVEPEEEPQVEPEEEPQAEEEPADPPEKIAAPEPQAEEVPTAYSEKEGPAGGPARDAHPGVVNRWAVAKAAHNASYAKGDLTLKPGDRVVVTRAHAGDTWWSGYVEQQGAIGELKIEPGALDAVSGADQLKDERLKALLQGGSGEARLFVKDAGLWQGYCELTPSAVGQFPSSALTIVAGGPPDAVLRGRVDDATKLQTDTWKQTPPSFASGGAIVITTVAATCDVTCLWLSATDAADVTVPQAVAQELLDKRVARVVEPAIGQFPSSAVDAVPPAPTHLSLTHPSHGPGCTKLVANWAVGDPTVVPKHLADGSTDTSLADDEQKITAYQLRVYSVNAETGELIPIHETAETVEQPGGAPVRQHSIGDLHAATQYTFVIRAKNDEDWGPWSSHSPITSTAAPIVGTPKVSSKNRCESHHSIAEPGPAQTVILGVAVGFFVLAVLWGITGLGIKAFRAFFVLVCLVLSGYYAYAGLNTPYNLEIYANRVVVRQTYGKVILPLKDIVKAREIDTTDRFDLLQIWLPTRYQMRITEFSNIVVIPTKNCCTGWGIAVSVHDSAEVVREINAAKDYLETSPEAGKP